MRNTVNILGVNVDKMNFKDSLDFAVELCQSEGTSAIFTPNPEIIMCAREDAELRDILNGADLCTPDGIGVVYGAKILGEPVAERVAGFDLVCGLLEKLSKTGDGVFLFGAKPGVADAAKAKMEETYPGINVCGCHHGYFKEEDTPGIVKMINESGAKLLLVCLGAPKQEKWIAANRDKLGVNLCMGVGGTLDVFAGTAKRAPKLFIKLNLEWAYRILKNPSRIGRFMALPKFAFKVMGERVKGGKRK